MGSFEYDVWLEFKVCEELEVKVGELKGGSGAGGGRSSQVSGIIVGDVGDAYGRLACGRGVLDASAPSAGSWSYRCGGDTNCLGRSLTQPRGFLTIHQVKQPQLQISQTAGPPPGDDTCLGDKKVLV